MLEFEKIQLVEYGNRLYNDGLTRSTGGNLSIFNREKNLMIITPSGIPYSDTRVEDIVVMDLDNNIVEGNKKPSSEFPMHTAVYKARKDINSMIHMHATFCSTLSTLRKPLPAVDYLVALCGGTNVPIAEYASYGTQELADNAVKAMGMTNAVLLANHGINVVGQNISETYYLADQLEFCAELYIRALSCGTPYILDDKEMIKMVSKFETYGQKAQKK